MEEGKIALHVRPVILLVKPVDIAFEVDTPSLDFLGRKAQRFEGDSHFRRPSVIENGRGGFPDCFNGIFLNSLGIDGEADAGALVVVGIKEKRYGVVVFVGVPWCELRPNLFRQGILHVKSEVDVFLIVGGPDLRFLRSGHSVFGVKLKKSRRRLHIAPTGIVEDPVYFRRRADTGNMDCF